MHKWWIALLLGAFVTGAGAVESITPPKEAESAMKKFSIFMKIEGWFKGPGNLLGVAARFSGQPMVFFTDPEGRYMLTGAAVEVGTGKNLIAEATAKYFSDEIENGKGISALPSPVKSSIDRKVLQELQGVSQGAAKSGKKAYVIFDFGCAHCMRLYQALEKEKFAGELKWVPVTFSGEVATTKAALAIGLGKIDPVLNLSGKSLVDAVMSNKESLGRGAMAVENNTKIIQDRKITSTPHFFFERDGMLMEHSGYAGIAGLVNALGVR